MIETFINVRGLSEERRNLSWQSTKCLNFTMSRDRELYKRGVNATSWFSAPDLLERNVYRGPVSFLLQER
jgi:hypothetical protein